MTECKRIFFRNNWKILGFLAVMLFFSLALITSQPSDRFYLCSEEEKTVIVCIRNWANASGNLLTGFVALAAAIFAFLQFRAADRQAAVALLPSLAERIAQAITLKTFVTDYKDNLRILRYYISDLQKWEPHESSIGNLMEVLLSTYENVSACRDIHEKIFSMSTDLKNESEILKIASEMCAIYLDFEYNNETISELYFTLNDIFTNNTDTMSESFGISARNFETNAFKVKNFHRWVLKNFDRISQDIDEGIKRAKESNKKLSDIIYSTKSKMDQTVRKSDDSSS